MSWGNKLMIVFICFGTLMSYMVYRCVKTPVNLVSKEYYKDELAYQEVIDGRNKAQRLTRDINVYQVENYLTLEFPEEMQQKLIQGKIWFYCPSASGNDRKLLIETDEHGFQKISRDSLMAGRYIIKINWEVDNENYYTEQSLNLQ